MDSIVEIQTLLQQEMNAVDKDMYARSLQCDEVGGRLFTYYRNKGRRLTEAEYMSIHTRLEERYHKHFIMRKMMTLEKIAKHLEEYTQEYGGKL